MKSILQSGQYGNSNKSNELAIRFCDYLKIRSIYKSFKLRKSILINSAPSPLPPPQHLIPPQSQRMELEGRKDLPIQVGNDQFESCCSLKQSWRSDEEASGPAATVSGEQWLHQVERGARRRRRAVLESRVRRARQKDALIRNIQSPGRPSSL